MKNKKYKLLFLGINTAIVATASYALIAPNHIDIETTNTTLTIPTIKSTPASILIHNPTTTETDFSNNPKLRTAIHTIKAGESLSSIFSKLKLSQVDLQNIISTKNNKKQFESIIPGKELTAYIDSKNRLQQLVYQESLIRTLKVTRSTNNNTFNIKIISKPIEKRIASIQATINSSLFIDGVKAGLPNKIIAQLEEIFAWDIDFALNLRKNDKITVVYEKLYVDNNKYGTGNILSAEFINQGTSYTAVRFEDKNGNTGYFTPKGKSMRKAFLRTPVDFARISSHFNLKRKHPVLNTIRAHKGVDYSAKKGTIVKTTGNGKIIFRGNQGGYGKVVIVQHGKKYSTLYAHLSNYKKGQKTGSYVKQGQTIGYVGKSGLATGSHLHYEFRVNGTHRNPLTVKLPLSQPVKKSLLAEFKEQTLPLVALLDKAKITTLLAHNKH